MLINCYTCNSIPYAVVDNFYTEEELSSIFLELEFLTDNLNSVDKTNAANVDGVLQAKKRGVFLDDLFNERHFSNILNHNRKIFSKDFYNELKNFHPWFRYIPESNRDSTLLSYYEDSDYYEPHIDHASITTLHWFYKEPKKFVGGDLRIEKETVIECLNNRVVVIPSVTVHEVIPIKMEEKDKNKKLGRYCCSTFITLT